MRSIVVDDDPVLKSGSVICDSLPKVVCVGAKGANLLVKPTRWYCCVFAKVVCDA